MELDGKRLHLREPPHRTGAPQGERHAEGCAAKREDERFRQQLALEAPARRAQRRPQRQLAASANASN